MRLAEDWRLIVRKAWSVRLMILAALLTGVEVLLPLTVEPSPWFSLLSFLLILAALFARVIAQRDFR